VVGRWELWEWAMGEMKAVFLRFIHPRKAQMERLEIVGELKGY
jgi:hypothetical protein